jgi:phosphate starvation-inducible PhoH-like protein
MSKKKRTAKAAAVVSQASPTEANDKSPYVFQRDKINYSLNVRELPWTDKQKEIINLFLDKKTKVLFLKGVAGTSKTTLAMYCGLQLLNNHRVSDLVLIRSAVESADSKMGYLPGTIDEKFGVYLAPFNDKFTELLPKPQIDKLEKDNRIAICPINYARGLHFAVKFVCCDEAQNLTVKEIQTMMTRLGEFCKVIVCGDPEQSDLPYGKSGFMRVYDSFNNEEATEHGIFCKELGEEDIVRSELCKFIVHKFKDINIARQLEEANAKKKS